MMRGNPNLQPVQKRKKHAPDRQQPEWLFPQDSQNPALKPHQEPSAQQKLEKQRSIDFLTRRSVGAPAKPAPPIQLLNLIGVFLAEYGFTSTGRIFSTERQGRSKLDGWKDENGGKLERGMPTLNKIYKEWRKEWEERRQLEMTSSDEEDDAATKREKMLMRKNGTAKQRPMAQDDDTSSSGSNSDDESDAPMKDVSTGSKTITKKALSSSSSDSDADDEEEAAAVKVHPQKPKDDVLKRKASPSSTSSSGSDSSSAQHVAPKTKNSKPAVSSSKSIVKPLSMKVGMTKKRPGEKAEKPSSQSCSDSTSASASASDSSQVSLAKKIPLPTSPSSGSASESSSVGSSSDPSSKSDNKTKTVVSSDTSATLSDRPKKLSPAGSDTPHSVGESGTNSKDIRTASKRKFSPPLPPSSAPKRRKGNEPFQRVSKDIKVDQKLASNAYVPYDYAQKAHEDLVVTKGKSFTKEKNKKKRGSYKGGYIDVEGKKGIKFED